VNSATGHFIAQRVTAIALVLLGLWFAFSLTTMTDFSHAEVVAAIKRPVNLGLLLVLTVTMAYHSYLGVQVVIEDYVHGAGLHKASLIFSRIAHLAVAVVTIYAAVELGMSA
jgi:succinate dehydrogenase / fumarate reductase membrane anchor subunit